MSCSMTTSAAPISRRRRSSTGASASTSRWAMPLDGSSSRITVGRCATWQARSTTRRVPVDSSRTNELRIRADPHQLDQLVDAQRGPLLVVVDHRQAQRGRERAAVVDPPLERHGERLA